MSFFDSAPMPLQREQVSYLLMESSFSVPKAASSKEIVREVRRSLPRVGLLAFSDAASAAEHLRENVLKATEAAETAELNPSKSICGPLCPKRSYCWRFPGSLRTS